MKRLKKILFPTDFSTCARQAAAHVAHLAQKFSAEVHMIHAVVLFREEMQGPFPGAEELAVKLEEEAARRMEKHGGMSAVDRKHLKTAQIRSISPAEAILRYSSEKEMDLIVMGTHGRRGIEHLLLGSVTEEVVRQAPCPVFTIRETRKPREIHDIKKILVPVDFSQYAQKALANAKALAKIYGAELQLLHVIENVLHPAFYAGGQGSLINLAPDVRERAGAAMAEMLEKAPGGNIKGKTFVVDGKPSREIITFAEKNHSDMIVIATHGLTGIEHFLLGSTTEQVVRRAPCPVFTVKAFGKSLL